MEDNLDSSIAHKTTQRQQAFPEPSTVDALLALIKNSGKGPGQQLPSQRQLAERLGVSRPTVREALVALETMGLVRIRPGRGIFLLHQAAQTVGTDDCEAPRTGAAQPSSRTVQMYQFRYVVEPVVAGLAAQNATSAQIEDLRQLVERMREALGHNDASRLGHLNCAFHQQVIEAANNPFFTKSLAPTLLGLLENQPLEVTVPPEVVAEHQAVVEALMARASGKTRRAMRRHIGAVAARARIALDLAH